MRKIKIPKKTKGEFRTIYKPSKTEKQALKDIFPQILIKALSICNLDVCQGFFPNTSPVTNALCHVGYKYTTMFDLKDFFDSITVNQLRNLTKDELDLVLVDGSPRQGLPTSPIIANLAASTLDSYILWFIDYRKFDCKYTRYADDLCFSYNDKELTETFLKAIPWIAKSHFFEVNPKKTRTMSASNGRRIITGIAVDDFGIHPTRRTKRKMRAALHNGNKNKYEGLKEWCKLKKPNYLSKIELENFKQEFSSLLNEWGESNNELLCLQPFS